MVKFTVFMKFLARLNQKYLQHWVCDMTITDKVFFCKFLQFGR